MTVATNLCRFYPVPATLTRQALKSEDTLQKSRKCPMSHYCISYLKPEVRPSIFRCDSFTLHVHPKERHRFLCTARSTICRNSNSSPFTTQHQTSLPPRYHHCGLPTEGGYTAEEQQQLQISKEPPATIAGLLIHGRWSQPFQ
jgi:hypothetical protein